MKSVMDFPPDQIELVLSGRQADEFIEMPSGVSSIFTPILYAVPLQLFAYYMSVEKGLNPDQPRSLAKSVTVL